MTNTRSFDMFITSVISLTLIRQPSSTIWWTLAMFSTVVAVFGRPERSSSPKLLRPRLNSAAQNVTVANDGAESLPLYRIQLSFDLRIRIAFQKPMFNDSLVLNFILNSLKRLLHNNCASKWLKLWLVTVNRWTTKFTSFYLRVLLYLC